MPKPTHMPDRLLGALDRALKALTTQPAGGRPNPAGGLPEADLSDDQRKRSVALLRVNHAGEIAAQALYEGQGAVARSADLRHQFRQAAAEERDHLAWCSERLTELNGRPSALTPLWYAGAYTIGLLAGTTSDRTSLGFVRETERQVVEHLHDHLSQLPPADRKSATILEHMAEDEAHHGSRAADAGALELPTPVRLLMKVGGGVLRRVAYWV
jgi:ubiquinone biosynthesis monooxygenase Coq7